MPSEVSLQTSPPQDSDGKKSSLRGLEAIVVTGIQVPCCNNDQDGYAGSARKFHAV